MAQFRRGHQQASGGGTKAKFGIFAIIIGALLFGFQKLGEWSESSSDDKQTEQYNPSRPTSLRTYLPTSSTDVIINHDFYSLSYSEEHEQAEWVAYELTREDLNGKRFPRTNKFRTDPEIATGSAQDGDYRGSGYDRGHLVPAADMAFDSRAMAQSFYFSNMSPQVRNFNGGVWRELEELTRDWARKFKHLYIVTGPVLTRPILDRIGYNEVSVPAAYFKVILDLSEPEIKAIAYLMPNEVSYRPVHDFAVTIDDVEQVTGLDFFANLLDEDEEETLESEIDTELWPVRDDRFQQRVKQWNIR